MRRFLLRIIPTTILTAVFLTTSVGAVAAPATGGGQALEISPPIINLSGNPGQVLTTQISVRNISSGPLVISNIVNDFTADGETGLPRIITDPSTNPSPYSLRDWVRPIPQLQVQSQKTKQLTLTIAIPTNASPGGYYGVVRFTGTPPNLSGSGVSLSASLGSLLFIRVNGQANEQLSLAEFSMNNGGAAGSFFESTPVNFVERIQNTGNLYEQPVGNIAITDMFHKKIANVNVNLEGHSILPASTRKFTEALDSTVIGNKVLFGHYTATLTMKYGSNNQTLTKTIGFWIIPYRLIIGGIIVVLILFFILRFAIRRYNKHIISRANKMR